MKELLIVVALMVVGIELVRAYNTFEEPLSSRILRIAAAETPELK